MVLLRSGSGWARPLPLLQIKSDMLSFSPVGAQITHGLSVAGCRREEAVRNKYSVLLSPDLLVTGSYWPLCRRDE